MPIGEPRRELFIWGGSGSIILTIAAVCIGFFMISENLSNRLGYPWWFVIWSAIFSVGLFATSIGFYGFFRNYGSTLGLVTYIILVISSFIFIFSVIFSVHYYPYEPGGWGSEPAGRYSIEIEFIGAIEILGICLALMGFTFIMLRHIIMVEDMPVTVGIFNIIIALCFCSIILVVILEVVWILLAVACFLTSLVFFSAKLPPKLLGQDPSQAQVPKPLGGAPP
jgi:hypothetical protein